MRMIPFKYKIGDKVKVKPLDWFDKHCVCDEHGYEYYGSDNIVNYINDNMLEYCDKEVTIIGYRGGAYLIAEDCRTWAWDKWMFEDKEKEVKEESREIVGDLLHAIGLENTDMFTFKNLSETVYKFEGTNLMEGCSVGSVNWVESDLTINDLINLADQIELVYFVDLQKVYTIDLTREDGVAELTYDSSDEHMKYLSSKKLLFKTKEEAKEYLDGVIVF